MTLWRRVLGLVIFLLLCQFGSAMALPEITAQSEPGFHDLGFTVVHYEKKADRSYVLDIAGLHAGKTVAFEAVLHPDWTEKKQPLRVYWGRVSFISLGTASDALASVLDAIYQTGLNPKQFPKEVSFEAVSLDGNPVLVEERPIKMKLFYASDDPGRYAEVYFNLDLLHNQAALNEKDPDYRKNIVRALGR